MSAFRALRSLLNRRCTSFVPPPRRDASAKEPRRVFLVGCHPELETEDSSYHAALFFRARSSLIEASNEVVSCQLDGFRSIWESSATLDDASNPLLFCGKQPVMEGGEDGQQQQQQQQPRRRIVLPFHPSPTAEEHQLYREAKGATTTNPKRLHQLHKSLRSCDDYTKVSTASLQWCDSMVLVYPTWWFGLPAALKGFVDRTFLPGVAFALPTGNDSGSLSKEARCLEDMCMFRLGNTADSRGSASSTGLIPLLSHIDKVAVITTHGASWIVTRYVGDAGRRMIVRGICPLMGYPEVHWMSLYDMDSTTMAERRQFLDHVDESMRTF